jgi:hypothetical protein
MTGALFVVRIRAGEKCISVPRTRAIISPKGMFAWDVFFPAGTSVVVELFDGLHELRLSGTISRSVVDSGVAIEFKKTTETVARKLEVLLAA